MKWWCLYCPALSSKNLGRGEKKLHWKFLRSIIHLQLTGNMQQFFASSKKKSSQLHYNLSQMGSFTSSHIAYVYTFTKDAIILSKQRILLDLSVNYHCQQAYWFHSLRTKKPSRLCADGSPEKQISYTQKKRWTAKESACKWLENAPM